MSRLQRLDAIASGIVGLVAGGTILAFMTGIVWEPVGRIWRQEEVTGVVVAQEATQVCQNTGRSKPWRFQCDRKVMESCPIVQYQPETGEPLKLKDCSLRLAVGDSVTVMYDRNAPTDARTDRLGGTLDPWEPLLFSAIPMGVGLLLLVIGGVKLWEGTRGMKD